MKSVLLSISIHLATILSFANVDSIFNKTWQFEDGLGNIHYVFFAAESGILKAIKQINGSGICEVKSEIYDLEIIDDLLILKNGIDLKTGEKTNNENFVIRNEKIENKDGNMQMTLFSNDVFIYNWATDEVCDLIEFNELLKTIKSIK